MVFLAPRGWELQAQLQLPFPKACSAQRQPVVLR
jgi:hypothetical protein